MKTLEFIVKEIPEGQFELHEVLVPAAEIDLKIEEVQFIGEIHGHLQLLRRVQEVYVRGSFSGSIEVACRRCVEPFVTSIETDTEVQFYPTDEPKPTDAWQMDTGERYYSESIIDLSDEVRQAFILEIPTWSLCSEVCKGLCPQCGEDLNFIDCGCHPSEERSSPFAALGDLLNQPDRAVGNGF